MATATPTALRLPVRGHLHLVTDLPPDDTALVSGVVERDEAALEAIYRAYGGAVKSIARRVLHDEVLAEDVVQDVFVTLWRSPGRFDPDRGSLRTYLLTMAHRRAVDIVRSEVARSAREEKSPLPEPDADLEGEVWKRSQSEIVREAVAQLRDEEREAISLAYFSGLTYIEVAQRLQEPEGTVKSRIRSGMRKLAGVLAETAT